jgi:transposase InsO family protein
VGLARSTARYQGQCPEDEAELVEQLHRFARRRRRRGYRLAHQELRQRGHQVNHKRVYRLWKREKLNVPPRKKRKRVRQKQEGASRPLTATAPNAVWCLDFVQDSTLSGGKLRILCITDEFTRESLAIEVGSSFRSERVCRVLEEVMNKRAVPGALRMDNGPEFVALSLGGLCHRKGINPAYIEPGKPWQNGFAESFHSRLRDEFLDGEVFHSVGHAQVCLDTWRRDWNEERLHSSLGYLTPNDFAAQWTYNGQKHIRTQATIGS